jgi:tetratricopeptide (TPR) repeat protein
MSNDLHDTLQRHLAGNYTVERELGGGGMSRVFVATETRLGRRVVIKVLAPEVAAEISTQRFEREIQTAASLQQANIVPVLTAGDAGGVPFFTMPFVEGESLRAHLVRSGPLSIPQATHVMSDVARALAYAHEHGIVHRDIKPDNVLLSRGAAVVTDFGIAKAIVAARTDGDESAPTLTQLGSTIGTPAYMAPEQAAGDPSTDHRADIYAFGCTAYELLTGRPPFVEKSPQRLLAAHMAETPTPVERLRPDTPPMIATLVARCLEKEPTRRPRSADELLEALDAMATMSGGTLNTLPITVLGRPGMFTRALVVYGIGFLLVAFAAKGAISVIGLPDWVFPAALAVMALGLPVVLFAGYVAYVTRRAVLMSPTFTPGGSAKPRVHGTFASIAMKASPHVSWRRVAAVGVWAVVALIGVVGAFMSLRAAGIGPFGSLLASGKLNDRDQIIVADFKINGPDTALAGTLATLMNTSLGQSEAIRLMPASSIAAALQRMQRPLDSRMDVGVARDVARREGARAVVSGELTPLAQGYVVSAKLVAATTGDLLWSSSETADGPKELLHAVDRLARQLRGKIGESLKAVHGDPPLELVTTTSFEALKNFSDGTRAWNIEGDEAKAVRLLKEAVALDTTFAQAHVKLARVLNNTGLASLEQRIPLIERAYRHGDRLTEPERLDMLAAFYEQSSHRDVAKTAEASVELASRYPTWPAALNNAGSLMLATRQYARAESFLKQAIKVVPHEWFSHVNVAYPKIALGKFSEAREAIALSRTKVSALPGAADLAEARVLYNMGKLDSSIVYTRRVAALPLGLQQLNARNDLGFFYTLQGHVRAAVANLASMRSDRAQRGRAPPRLADSLTWINVAITHFEQPVEAARRLDAALTLAPLATLPPSEREYARVATLYAKAGRPDRALTVLAEYDRVVTDSAQRRIDAPLRHSALGWIALAQNKISNAVGEFRESDRVPYGGPCPMCIDAAIGLAFDRANMPDSAIAAYEHFVRTPYSIRVAADAFDLPWILRRLGALYQSKGDVAKSLLYYRRFVELWKNADPELQPQVADARRTIASLEARQTPSINRP